MLQVVEGGETLLLAVLAGDAGDDCEEAAGIDEESLALQGAADEYLHIVVAHGVVASQLHPQEAGG